MKFQKSPRKDMGGEKRRGEAGGKDQSQAGRHPRTDLADLAQGVTQWGAPHEL